MVTAGFVRVGASSAYEAYGLTTSPSDEWPTLSLSAAAASAATVAAAAHRTVGRTTAAATAAAATAAVAVAPPSAVSPAHHQQQQQQPPPPPGLVTAATNSPKNPKLYKTELCRSWMDTGRCNYGERCQYAHGEAEKRPIPRHPKYKTEACQSYHQTGYCNYGARCHFIHNEEPHILAQLVAANAAATAASKQQQQAATVAAVGVLSSSARPTHLLARSIPTSPIVAASSSSSQPPPPQSSSVVSSPHLQRAQQQPPPPSSQSPVTSSRSSIAQAAALAAVAFNQQPQLFSRQFHSQLQMYNDNLKTASYSTIAAAVGMPTTNNNHPTTTNPTTMTTITSMTLESGDSPIPSSNDSGTASPANSFSPGVDLLDDAHTGMLMRRQLELTKLTTSRVGGGGGGVAASPTADWLLAREFAALSAARCSQPRHSVASVSSDTIGMAIGHSQLPSSLSSDADSGFLSSASSCASSGGSITKPLNSPIVSSPPIGASSSFGASRLPVFERLSNGP